jgi:hypothetical protein
MNLNPEYYIARFWLFIKSDAGTSRLRHYSSLDEQLQKKWKHNNKVPETTTFKRSLAPNVRLYDNPSRTKIFTILAYIRFNFLQYTTNLIAL